MLKIGQFSNLAKTTIKTLRYYEKENLLKPIFIDNNGYRFYDTKQLKDLGVILSLRQIGLSINEIKKYLNGCDLNNLLDSRKKDIENNLVLLKQQLSQIDYMMGENNMKYEVVIKELPDYTVYYKEGIIKDFSYLTDFILGSGEECIKLNPNIKCVNPDYCYVNYLDGEYRDKDIRIRYAQAVLKEGVESDTIKFKKLDKVKSICIYHKGSYEHLREAYAFIMKYIEDNGYEMIEFPRERYIDGIWNKDKEEDWLTEIEVPIKSK